MTENDAAKVVVDACIKVHTTFGPGLLESIYEGALEKELRKRGLVVARQVAQPVFYEGEPLGDGFFMDLVVENCLVLELKSVEKLVRVHFKQLQTYLKLSGHKLGLLVNFGEERVKDGIHRVVCGLVE